MNSFGSLPGFYLASDGATKNGDAFEFPLVTDTSTWDGSAGSLSASGTAQLGYTFAGGNYVSVTNPSVTINADGTGSLSAVTEGVYHDYVPTLSSENRNILDLDFSAVTPVVTDTSITWTDVPAYLTEDGVTFLYDISSMDYAAYAVGDAVSPVTVVIDYDATELPVTLEVSQTTDLSATDDVTITVTGSGFDSETASSYMPGTDAGVYVQVGKIDSNWQPSAGGTAVSSRDPETPGNRAFATSAWVTNQATMSGQVTWLDEATGSFSVELTFNKAQLDALNVTDGEYAVFTTVAGGAAANAKYELSQTLSFESEDDSASEGGSTGEGSGDEGSGNEGTDTAASGSLIWGVKESFRTYVTGTIASGAIELDDVAENATGEFVWSNGTGSYDSDAQIGELALTGSVHFTGHSGQLDVTLANPRIEITSETTATLYVDVTSKAFGSSPAVNETGVAFATLSLSSPVTSDEEISWVDAGATLTADGAAAFAGFYQEGQALDPVTFTLDLSSDSTPTPTVSVSSSSVAQGDALTVSVSGLTEGQKVSATVHSEPVALGTVSASASGTASWSWKVPTDFATGQHTVEVTDSNGTVLASTYFTVVAAEENDSTTVDKASSENGQTETVQEDTCTAYSVSGASVSWGFKQSFVDYIEGSIGNGSISGSWGAGSGAYNTESNRGSVSFTGSVHYTGHSGLLDITLSNLRIQVNSATSATIYLDVESKAYGDNPGVSASNVAFATVSLPTATQTGSVISWSGASVTLTSAGADGFMGYYSAGETLDTISFSFPLGDTVECDDTTSSTLSGTSASSGTPAVGLAAGVLGLGVLLMAAGYRSRARLLAR